MTHAEFKQLQSYWYKVAASTGFQDIERPGGTLSHELSTSNNKFHKRHEVQIYVSLAQDILNNHVFADDVTRAIWSLHCDGKSLRKIAAELNLGLARVREFVKVIQKQYKLRRETHVGRANSST